MSEHTHVFSKWPFESPINTMSFCTAKVAREDYAVLQVTHDWDGDWQFLDATTEQPEDCVLLCLGCVFEKDQSLSQIADLPIGWTAWREDIGSSWSREEIPPEDEDEI